MTREEFGKGWLLLTTQPWGKAYRTQDQAPRGTEPTPGEVQLAWYYKCLTFCNPYVWLAVCETHAKGERWPSVDELKTTIAQNTPAKKTFLLQPPGWNEAPEPLARVMQYATQHAKTIKESTVAVLPGWLASHASHVDYADARLFLESAQGNFGVKTRTRGDVRVPT